MFLLKTRQNVGTYSVWYLTRWSSGISDKSHTELLEHISKQDKIKSDQFRTLLPHIQERNKSPPSYKLSAADAKLQQPPLSELTNIFDPAPEPENNVPNSNLENNLNDKSAIAEENMCGEETTECPSVNTIPEKEQPPKSLPVLISSFDTNTAGFQWDLASAALPISLHRGEGNFLTVAVAKDLKHAYFKTLETTEYWCMLAQQQGTLVCKAAGLSVDTGTIGSITREKALILIEKSSLWLCEPKPSAASSPKTEESLVDKIKKAIERILTAFKAKLEEQKKATEQKKKEEQKKEVNPNKVN